MSYCNITGVIGENPLNLNSKEKDEVMVKLIDGLLQSGLPNMSQNVAFAIAANVYAESSFNYTAVNSSSGAYGLCQWLGNRYTNLKTYCSQNGCQYNTPEGQIKFLIYELQNSEKNAYSATVQQAANIGVCAVTFCDKFERPGHQYCVSRDKKAYYVQDRYNKIKSGG